MSNAQEKLVERLTQWTRSTELTVPGGGFKLTGRSAVLPPIVSSPRVAAWCLYDWANSAFGTVIATFVFAPYFVKQVASDPASGMAYWGYASATAGLFIAILAPLLGKVADRTLRRTLLLTIFTTLCALASCTLYFVEPNEEFIPIALVMFFVATVSAELAWVIYNSTLPAIAPKTEIASVSGYAWALGYAGGVASLLTAKVLLIDSSGMFASLDHGSHENVRAAAILAGLWFFCFSLPYFFFVRDDTSCGQPFYSSITSSLTEAWQSVRNFDYRFIDPNMRRFLIAHLFSSNGFVSMFAFAGIFASGTIGMELSEIITFAIAINLIAGLGAAASGYLDAILGTKRLILLSLFLIVLSGIGVVSAADKLVFWLAGMGLGFWIGPAQSASRTLMVRLAPSDRSAEFFGFYALAGKATVFLGPLLVATVTDLTANQRLGVATILLLYCLGFFFYCFVDERARS